jgi:hypothetical protein
MKQYYHLDVYKSSYKLLILIYQNLSKLNKEYKYTVGEKIKDKSFEILLNIYKISRHSKRDQIFENTFDNLEIIRLSIRLLRDLNVLNDKKFAILNLQIEDVLEQFTKWHKFESKK